VVGFMLTFLFSLLTILSLPVSFIIPSPSVPHCCISPSPPIGPQLNLCPISTTLFSSTSSLCGRSSINSVCVFATHIDNFLNCLSSFEKYRTQFYIVLHLNTCFPVVQSSDELVVPLPISVSLYSHLFCKFMDWRIV